MKETKRKYFKFYRSYYDVMNELSDKDKLLFINALLDKQFLDVEPKEFKGILKVAWVGLWNSIDQQVKGYKHKSLDPMQGGRQGGKQAPEPQEKEKEKEEVEYTIPAFEDFLTYAKEKKPKVDAVHLKLKYDAWVENKWKDGNDRKIKNWKTKLLNTLKFIDEVKNNEEGYVFGKTGFLHGQ